MVDLNRNVILFMGLFILNEIIVFKINVRRIEFEFFIFVSYIVKDVKIWVIGVLIKNINVKFIISDVNIGIIIIGMIGWIVFGIFNFFI